MHRCTGVYDHVKYDGDVENEVSYLYLFLNRYTAENSMKYGAPRDTAHPELRQPLAFDVWQQVTAELGPTDKITILTNGPLINIANIILVGTLQLGCPLLLCQDSCSYP